MKHRIHYKSELDWVLRTLCTRPASLVRHTNNAGRVTCKNCLARMKEMEE